MGTGSIPKLLAQLAIPAVAAQIINLLYNIVDRIYIGHMPEVGAEALTGVGLFMPFNMLITAFAMLCGAGGAPRAAIAMGQKDHDTAEKIVANCFALMLVPRIFVSIFNSDPALVEYTSWAMRIYMAGIFSVGFQSSCQQSFMALGQAKISLLMACLRKIVLRFR